jgi:uncharacterized protein (TIGR02246 family)
MKFQRIALTLAAVAAFGVAGTSIASADRDGDRHDQRPSEAEVREQFDRWNAALQSGDPERVADQYAPDGVLIPTLSNEPRDTRAEIVDYFENHFLPSKPVGTITESLVNVLDRDTAIDQGTYVFNQTKPDGTPFQTLARYTFVYEKDASGNWKIVSHHSSKFPEG